MKAPTTQPKTSRKNQKKTYKLEVPLNEVDTDVEDDTIEEKKEEEPIQEEKVKKNKNKQRLVKLREDIDMKALRIIRDNWDIVYQRMPRPMQILQNGQWVDGTKDECYASFYAFYQQKIRGPYVQYNYSRNADSGRRFGPHSLQGIHRSIRHTLAKDISEDWDIANAHPTFLKHLCTKLEFEHPILDSYISNRTQKLNEWATIPTIRTTEKAKQLFLKIMNGGGEKNGPCEELNRFYKRQQEFLDLFYKQDEFKKYVSRANRKKSEWNRKGTALNYYLCDVEDDILWSIEEILSEMNIEYGTLCFDGLMVYRKSIERTNHTSKQIITQIEIDLKKKFGFDIHLKVKEMDEGVDISGLTTKEINLDQLSLAKVVLEHFKDDYKYEHTLKRLWVWDDSTKLWLRQSMSYFAVIMIPVLKNYIGTSPDLDMITQTLDQLNTNSFQNHILSIIQRHVEAQRDDDFVRLRFNQSKGLFPITEGRVVDLHTNTIRLREKTDYFTMASTMSPQAVTAEGRDKLMNYFHSILMTDNRSYVDYFLTLIAYTMTGENNKKVVVNLIGGQDAGKSLLLKLLGIIMGTFSAPMNERIVIKKKNETVHDSELLGLRNIRCATISELEDKQQMNAKTLKTISGGDSISARGAGKEEMNEILLSCVLWIATNQMPQFDDPAFASRLNCFHFKNHFERNPLVERNMVELCPQLFTLLCEYALAYYESGEQLLQPPEVVAYTNKIVADRDSIAMFLQTIEQTNDTNDFILRSDVFERYQTFCQEESIRSPSTKSRLFERVEKVLGNVKQKKVDGMNYGRGFIGVRWRNEED